MPEKLPKIMHEWEQEMVNVRKHSASQPYHADPLPHLCLRGRCMELLQKMLQQPEKNKDKLPQLLFLQTTEIHSNEASLILPVVIKL